MLNDDLSLQKLEFGDIETTLEREETKMIDTISHYFLSLIRVGSETELDIARKRTLLAFYGRCSEKKLVKIFDALSTFLFSSDLCKLDDGDEIFNEREFFFKNDMFKIDRLVFNRSKKTIVAIDYITSSYEISELDRTISVLGSIYPEFNISKKLVNIDLNILN